MPNTPVSAPRLNRWTGHKRASLDQLWARNRDDCSLHLRSTWKVHRISTWLSSHGRVHGKVHDGPRKHTRPSMQCMSAFLGGCPASMLRVASQWGAPAEPDIFSQIVICLFCMRISTISRPSSYVTPVTKENMIVGI